MQIIDLDLEHWNFYCPATGHKIQADGEGTHFPPSLKGLWIGEIPDSPEIKDPGLQRAWNQFINNFDEEANQERHYTFKNGTRLEIDNIGIYGLGQFSYPTPENIIIGSLDVLENDTWREATDEELIEINEDKSFLDELCSQSDLRSSVSNDFLKNYNAPNWIAFHIRSGTAAFNDSAMYIIDMNTRNQKTLTNS